MGWKKVAVLSIPLQAKLFRIEGLGPLARVYPAGLFVQFDHVVLSGQQSIHQIRPQVADVPLVEAAAIKRGAFRRQGGGYSQQLVDQLPADRGFKQANMSIRDA